MSETSTQRETKLPHSEYAEVEDENIVKTEEVLTMPPKIPKSNEDISECFKLEPIEKLIHPRFFYEATKPNNIQHIDNEIEHIKEEIILETEINEVLKKAYNNLKSKAPNENKLQATIHNIISENSDEDVIDKSCNSLYPLANVINETENWNTIKNQGEQETNNAHDTKVIDVPKKKLPDKNLLHTKDKKLSNKNLLTFNPAILCNEKMLNEVDVISKTSTNLVDETLAIEIRNCFGRCKFVALKESKQETMLQEAIQQWKEWQAAINVRGVPLCYKCYVCKIAFWHLHPFREHIQTHESIEISAEFKLECSINASETESELQNFHIDSDCWRCGKDFKSHPTLMNPDGHYRCSKCNKLFFTCSSLKLHENVCVEFLHKHANAKSLQCTLCPLVVWQEDELAIHMELSHSVRSDLPIAGPPAKLCECCNLKYVCRALHICNRKKHMYVSCKLCNKLFPTLETLKMHMQYSNTKYKCPICNITLTKQCTIGKHLIVHSENFQMIYISVICNKIFLDRSTVQEHNWRQHRKKKNKKCNFYDTIIVLKKAMECVTSLEIYSNQSLLWNAVCEDTIERNNIKINTTPAAKKSDIIEEHIPNNNTVTSQNTINNKDINVINEYDNVFVKEEMDLVLNDDNDSINGEINIKTEQDEYVVDKEELVSVLSDLHQSEDTDRGIVKEEIEELCEDNIQNELGDVDVLNLNKVGRVMYKCTHCSFQSYHRQYKAHIEICHSMSTLNNETRMCSQQFINCSKCSNDNQRHQSLKRYLLHLHNVHNLDELQCPECRMIINNLTSLALHLNKHITGLYERVKTIKDKFSNESESNDHYMCRKCKMQVGVVNFFTHWETHLVLPGDEAVSGDVTMKDDEKEKVCAHGEQLGAEALKKLIHGLTCDTTKRSRVARKGQVKTCPHCKRHINYTTNAKHHIIGHLLNDAVVGFKNGGGFKCQICSETYKKVNDYKQHMRDHGGLKVYRCVCKRTFSDRGQFRRHQKVHDFGILICDICGKKYKAKFSLIKHLKTFCKQTLLKNTSRQGMFVSGSKPKVRSATRRLPDV